MVSRTFYCVLGWVARAKLQEWSGIHVVWENCWHFATPLLVSAGIPYWWPVITQNWVVTRHQYEISALVSPTSFRREASGGVTKCGLFSQVRILVHTIILFCITTIVILTILFTKKRTSVASWNIKIPIMGARQAVDCAMQRFNILGSIDYNCTFSSGLSV